VPRSVEFGASIAGQFKTIIGFGANLKKVPMPAGPPVFFGRKRTVVKILPLPQHLGHAILPVFPDEGHRATAHPGADPADRVSYKTFHPKPSMDGPPP
jgi:hypothetical protein